MTLFQKLIFASETEKMSLLEELFQKKNQEGIALDFLKALTEDPSLGTLVMMLSGDYLGQHGTKDILPQLEEIYPLLPIFPNTLRDPRIHVSRAIEQIKGKAIGICICITKVISEPLPYDLQFKILSEDPEPYNRKWVVECITCKQKWKCEEEEVHTIRYIWKKDSP
jgi:hypothetical protein